MVTLLLLLVALFFFSFTYRKAQLPLWCFLYQGEFLVLWWEWWLHHPQPALCVQKAPTLPSSSLILTDSSLLSLNLAAALLDESSTGQWVGFSPTCLHNFFFPHCTNSQQFQPVQRWAVPNLHYLYLRNSKGFFLLCVVSAVGMPSTTLLPAQAIDCFWQFVGNWILGGKDLSMVNEVENHLPRWASGITVGIVLITITNREESWSFVESCILRGGDPGM